jgi:hypothetical protein
MKESNVRKGFTCECGKEYSFPLYVYAHWTEELNHTCDCGRVHKIRNGMVWLAKQRSKPKGRMSK